MDAQSATEAAKASTQSVLSFVLEAVRNTLV